jgi:hypothetical protein
LSLTLGGLRLLMKRLASSRTRLAESWWQLSTTRVLKSDEWHRLDMRQIYKELLSSCICQFIEMVRPLWQSTR